MKVISFICKLGFMVLFGACLGMGAARIHDMWTLHSATQSSSLVNTIDFKKYGKPIEPWETFKPGVYEVEPLHPGRILYYRLTVNQHTHYYHIWQQAIAHWNALNVIHLVPAPSTYHGYAITLSGQVNSHIANNLNQQSAHHAVSIANTQSRVIQVSPTEACFTKVECTLGPGVNLDDKPTQIIVAEHELGHALGLAHENNAPSAKYSEYVMNWATRSAKDVQPLGAHEKAELADVYEHDSDANI